MNAQIIKKNGRPEWAVIPYAEYRKLNDAYEDAEDIIDIEKNLKAIKNGDELAIPSEITFAIIEGTSPIRVWRKYKKIKMNELAKNAGISSAYLSLIENKKRNPTIATLKKIAQALELDIESVT